MGLREKAQIGELRRQTALLQEQFARSQARVIELEREVSVLKLEEVKLRVACTQADALAQENERLAASLVDSRRIIDQLRAQLKHADEECKRLRETRDAFQAPKREMSKEEKILNFMRSSSNITAAAREHLLALFELAHRECREAAPRLQEPLVVIVSAYSRQLKLPPATCHDLARVLGTDSSFFNWAVRRSPIVSVAGRDDNNRVLYSLNLELLGCEDLPPRPGRAFWFNRPSG